MCWRRASHLGHGCGWLRGPLYIFGAGHAWSVPYYLDVGTGDSDLTWQGLLGLAYSFGWGDLGVT